LLFQQVQNLRIDQTPMKDADPQRAERPTAKTDAAGFGAAPKKDSTAPPLRLFVIPLLIVLAMVFVWIAIRLSTTPEPSPQQLVQDIAKLDDSSWLKAYALSRLLAESSDSSVANNHVLCRQLATLLDAELAAHKPGKEHIRLGVFLCRALGEFRITDGLPALCRAAAPRTRTPADVRCAAIEALAVQADHLGASVVAGSAQVVPVLLASSTVTGDDPAMMNSDTIRSRAAYTLGVLGGPRALDRLGEMLGDPDANVCCNAATGLARHGDPRALPMLLDMLDPTNPFFVADESDPEAKTAKRSLVMINALRAVTQLIETNCPPDTRSLRSALQRITADQRLPAHIRSAARDVLARFNHEPSTAAP